MALTELRVWHRTQRLFHWLNFLAVLTLAAIGTVILSADALGVPDDPGMILLKTTHVYVGYVFALNLAWRLAWAFFGGPYARWRALLPGGRDFGRKLREFVRGFVGGDAPFHLGYNPLVRILLCAVVFVFAVQAVTGLVLASTDVYMPPLGGAMREWVAGETHDPDLVRPYAPETVDPDAYAAMRAFRSPVVR